MAFERNYSVSLRHFLLIALLILIIHALSSDYGVNGEDQIVGEHSKSGNPAPEGILGVTKGSKSVTGHRRKLRTKTTTATLSSLSLLGSNTVQAADSKTVGSLPKSNPGKDSDPESDNKADGNGQKGPIGNTDMTNAKTGKDEEKEKKEEKVEKVVEKEEKKEEKKQVEKEDEKDKTLNQDKKVKPSKTGGGSEEVELNEAMYQEEEDDDDEGQDSAEIQLNPSENIFAEGENKNQLRKKTPIEDVSSASSFMTYFVVAVIVVIIAYLIFHNKKKLMAYIVEGRNTSRGRRQRPTSGAEYKPLKSVEEASGSRPEDA